MRNLNVSKVIDKKDLGTALRKPSTFLNKNSKSHDPNFVSYKAEYSSRTKSDNKSTKFNYTVYGNLPKSPLVAQVTLVCRFVDNLCDFRFLKIRKSTTKAKTNNKITMRTLCHNGQWRAD